MLHKRSLSLPGADSDSDFPSSISLIAGRKLAGLPLMRPLHRTTAELLKTVYGEP